MTPTRRACARSPLRPSRFSHPTLRSRRYTTADTVSVTFRSANPRNDQKLNGSFLSVDKKNDDGSYTTLFVDGDWNTKFEWAGGVGHLGKSTTTIEWDIAESFGGAQAGTYRICHEGVAKEAFGKKKDFQGCSSDFEVTA